MQVSMFNFRSATRFLTSLSPISDAGGLRWSKLIFWYAVSFGFMLLTWNALYWDDWIYYAAGPESVKAFSTCARCTLPLRSEIEGLLIGPGPWLMRLLTFVYFPMIVTCVWSFLRRTSLLNNREIDFVCALLLLLPMFGARIALINYQYSFSLLLFVLGSWLSLSSKWLVRLVALLPIFWSLFTASLQVFIIVLLAVHGVRLILKIEIPSFERLLFLGILAVFPLIHRYLLPTLFESFQATDSYNEIRTEFLIRAILVCGSLQLPLIVVLLRTGSKRAVSREIALASVGSALLGVGSFAYMSVGHFPNFSDWILPFLPDQSDWNSRHQLLQPFGVAFLFLSLVLTMGKFGMAFFKAVLAVCIVLNLFTYSNYYLDWRKQEAAIAWLTDNRDKFEGTTAIAVSDLAEDFNARGRHVRLYEWEGMIERATGHRPLVDEDSREFCESAHPSILLTVSPQSGRFMALMTGQVDLRMTIQPLPECAKKL